MDDFTDEIAETALGQEFCHLEGSSNNRLGVFGGRYGTKAVWELGVRGRCWGGEENGKLCSAVLK
jgi:hypothetical protein